MLCQEAIEQQPIHGDTGAHDRELQDLGTSHLLKASVHIPVVEHGRVRRAENHMVVAGLRGGLHHVEAISLRVLCDEPLGGDVQSGVQHQADQHEPARTAAERAELGGG